MRIIVALAAALLVGLAAGMAAVVAFAVSQDQDVREVFAKARKSVEDIDLEAVGAQVQQGIADAGARVQETVSTVMSSADQAAANGNADVADAIAETEAVVTA